MTTQPPRSSGVPRGNATSKLSHALALILIALAGCGGGGEPREMRMGQLSKTPLSVRGWIADVEGTAIDPALRTVETEIARRTELFGATHVWVENAPYVSGGVAENGSFVLLDVPPGNVTIFFAAPGVPSSALTLENIPGNADVLVPGIFITNAGVKVPDPAAVRIRSSAPVDAPRASNLRGIVAGHSIPVTETPARQMSDRRDFPAPPNLAPVATVR